MVRRLTALAVLVPALTVMSAPGGGPSVMAETTVSVEGRGFGHGIGMSQWGAYGYAVDQGWTAGQILDHYYGGTVAGSTPLDTTVSVRLQRLDDAQTAVVNEAGRLVVDGVTGGPWRSVLVREVSAAGQSVAYSVWARSDQQVCPPASGDPVASGWTLVAPSVATKVDVTTNLDTSAATSFADLPAVCEPATGVVRSYRGTIRAVNGTAGENRTVNVVPVEQYLRSVVAKEMSPSWASAGGGRGAQALQVQAVAARSYALAENRYSYARTCDTTSCQAYFGVASRTSVTAPYVQVEYPSTDAAVAAVAGVVRRVGTVSGQIAYTMYSASSGGYTAPGGGGLLPFPAVPDVGDSTMANPNRSWTTSLTGSQITAKYPTIGSFTAVSVEARNGFGDWGGRATSIKVQGSLGSVTVTGDQFRIAFGLKSTWIRFVGTVVEPDPCDGRVAPPVTGALGASAASMFNPVTPVRLIDTRAPGIGTAPVPLGAGCTMVVDPDLPATATALTVNVASIRPAVNGFLAVYPCGTARPTVSGLQALAGRTVAAAGTVTLGADGTFCIYSSITTNLIVDHFGWYGTASGVNFQPVTTTRLIDTRSRSTRLAAGTVLTVPVVRSGGAPACATA
ncbi:MAG: SpoIID/LytB domain-containing protein, partial [Ilumatobacteraceae bacterium]